MCGILGSIPAAEPTAFNKALLNLEHRGPDGSGVWFDDDGRVSLGHTRLAIVDLTDNAAQPMHYGKYTIVFNGEIYNHFELREQLNKLGHHFTSTSDTEVLVAAYLQWGAGCLERFMGMWAFAIWNKETNTLFFSRDRFGLKPFLYSQQGDSFIFASDMKGMAPLMHQFEVSDRFGWLARHSTDYEATEHCLIKGITRLRPGHYGIFQDDRLEIQPYYHLLENLTKPSEVYEERVERFREIVLDSVKLRLRADVPLGVALSGGLDSSCVLGSVMAVDKRIDPTVFTAHYPSSAIDELRYAQHLTSHFKLNHHVVHLDGKEALATMPDDLYYFEEIYRNAPSPMMALYREYRKQGVYVSLDGHGPDELFSGYDNFIFLALLDAGVDPEAWDDILATYKGLFPDGHGQFEQRNVNYLNVLKTRAWHLWDKFYAHRSDIERETMRKYADELQSMGYLGSGLFRLFNYTTFPTLLRNYDRFSMRSGVEVRMPFTDHRLVEFCFSLSWQDRIGDGYTKKLMRDAMNPFLPADIVWRKEKVGFQSPLSDWFAGPWSEWLADTIASVGFEQFEFSNPVKARNIHRLFVNGKNDLETANALWQELMPYLWHQHFYKRLANEL